MDPSWLPSQRESTFNGVLRVLQWTTSDTYIFGFAPPFAGSFLFPTQLHSTHSTQVKEQFVNESERVKEREERRL